MKKYHKIITYLPFLGLAFSLIILLSSYYVTSVWDEDIFRNNCPLFDQYGMSKTFLVDMDIQAPGPLYQIVHYIFKPITGYHVFAMRFVSFLLLVISIWLLQSILTKQENSDAPKFNALFYLAIPGVFATGVLAMSEMPTLVFVCLFLYLIAKMISTDDTKIKTILTYALFAGLALGLTIIGRSPMMVILPALLFALILKYKFLLRSYINQSVIIIICSALICIPVFIAWKGIIPPKIAALEAPIQSLNYMNFIRGMVQLALIAIIILPNLLYISKRLLLYSIIFFACFLGLDIFILHITIHSESISALLQHLHIPHILISSFDYIWPSMLFTIAFHMMLNMIYVLSTKSSNILLVVSILSIILIIATQMKMFNYSIGTRHMAQIAPFVIILIPALGSNKYIHIRFILGTFLGVLLISHHFFGTTTILW